MAMDRTKLAYGYADEHYDTDRFLDGGPVYDLPRDKIIAAGLTGAALYGLSQAPEELRQTTAANAYHAARLGGWTEDRAKEVYHGVYDNYWSQIALGMRGNNELARRLRGIALHNAVPLVRNVAHVNQRAPWLDAVASATPLGATVVAAKHLLAKPADWAALQDNAVRTLTANPEAYLADDTVDSPLFAGYYNAFRPVSRVRGYGQLPTAGPTRLHAPVQSALNLAAVDAGQKKPIRAGLAALKRPERGVAIDLGPEPWYDLDDPYYRSGQGGFYPKPRPKIHITAPGVAAAGTLALAPFLGPRKTFQTMMAGQALARQGEAAVRGVGRLFGPQDGDPDQTRADNAIERALSPYVDYDAQQLPPLEDLQKAVHDPRTQAALKSYQFWTTPRQKPKPRPDWNAPAQLHR